MEAKKELLYMADENGNEYVCYPKTLLECITNQNGDNVEETLKAFLAENALPLTGGTMSGDIRPVNGYVRIAGSANSANLYSYATPNDDNNRSYLSVFNAIASANRGDALMLYDYIDGVRTSYKLFGEHNKPRGTYTGTGVASSTDVIKTGGMGSAVLIWRTDADMVSLVTARGTIVGNGTTVTKLANSACWPTSGGIVLNTTSEYVNKAGVTYTYIHL